MDQITLSMQVSCAFIEALKTMNWTEARNGVEKLFDVSIDNASPMQIWDHFTRPEKGTGMVRTHMVYQNCSSVYGIPIVSSAEGLPYLVKYWNL